MTDDLIRDRAEIRNGWDDDDPDVTRIVRRVGAALNSGRDAVVVAVVLDETEALRAKVRELAVAAAGWKRLYDAAVTATVDNMHANVRAERAEATEADLRELVADLRDVNAKLTAKAVDALPDDVMLAELVKRGVLTEDWKHGNASGGGSLHHTRAEAEFAMADHNYRRENRNGYDVLSPIAPESTGIHRRLVTSWEVAP